MLDNNKYNLMEQMTKENQSLWRIWNNYLRDAADDEETREFWKRMEKIKEDQVERLEGLIRERVK